MQPERHLEIDSLITALPNPLVPSGFLERALSRPGPVAGRPVGYAVFRFPFGPLLIAFGDSVVLSQVGGHRVEFEDRIRDELQGRPEPVDPPEALQAAVEALAEGAGRLNFPVELERLGPFQQRVLRETQAIPHGEVATYRRIAVAIGAPAAARAVGTALARNPMPVVIPCHRVVRADARLGEYSGGGASVKARILRWEGVPVEARRGNLRVALSALASA